MYTFEVSERFLSQDEQARFRDCLAHHHLDEGIWEAFDCLFRSSTPSSTPLMLRAFEESRLCGAAIIIRNRKYGRALFDQPFLARGLDLLGVPNYLWMRFGCCMDVMSNPGFVVDVSRGEVVLRAMLDYLKRRYLNTVVMDYSSNAHLYGRATVLPYVPHGLIDTGAMSGVQEYLAQHKSLKRKLKSFESEGGAVQVIRGALPEGTLVPVRRCFLSTAEKSPIYTPYQELYMNVALASCSLPSEQVIHFVATLNGEFLGYQTAIQTGRKLNAMHGAFDRERETNFHAYEAIIVEMVDLAVRQGLECVDYGPVINVTKQRMVNRTEDVSDYVLSRSPLLQAVFTKLLQVSKLQGEQQLRFRGEKVSEYRPSTGRGL